MKFALLVFFSSFAGFIIIGWLLRWIEEKIKYNKLQKDKQLRGHIRRSAQSKQSDQISQSSNRNNIRRGKI